VIVVKLGGSVITEKGRRETLDGDALDRAADALAGASQDLVIVHGGGSFGHQHAAEWGVSVDEGTREAAGALAVHGAMTTLNRFVLDRLHARDVPALPVHPLSAASRVADGTLDLPLSQVDRMLAESFVPVLHGDVVATAGEGVTVLSGDEVVARVARDLHADRVGLCSTVSGVLDDADRVVDRVSSLDDAALGESAATDVTGGMAGKVRTLLDLDAPAHVFDLDGLSAFLAGESPGTVVD
jgi:isopentenyl phosphate kinase